MTRHASVSIPDSKLAVEITEFVRDTESELLFNHSSRVYLFAALIGERRGLWYEPELLYAAAMFHDIGLTKAHSSADKRFEVDGANAARAFLKSRLINSQDVEDVWTAIALHAVPGIPEFMHPVVALLYAGVEMDVLGIGYDSFTAPQRDAVVRAFPRTQRFKEDILQAFHEGIKHKPQTGFGNVMADVVADKDPKFARGDFCAVVRGSHWHG
jgi:hypothetical protein